ncbi:MAG: DUF4301 family protein, partial [Prevotella sp.]|nr:DUF4301 family protein [Prevotella sp.]
MLQKQDLKQIESLGITEQQVSAQLRQIAGGFPYLRLKGAAEQGNGIIVTNPEERNKYIGEWRKYVEEGGRTVVKFVPASGAASRMFKNLFAFLSAPYDAPTTDFERTFFAGIHSFA